jgi:SAM-dependent methyltransferase
LTWSLISYIRRIGSRLTWASHAGERKPVDRGPADVSLSRRMDVDLDDAMRAYYSLGKERDRLGSGAGYLEFLRTTEIVSRRLPGPNAVVADIGGGPGRYAMWLASLGYEIEHRDVMPLHVSQLAAEGAAGIRTAVGDARDIDLPDASVDAVLLLGPLYHLTRRSDRVRALAECARIVRPGGPVFAAAISRWSARMDGVLRARLYLEQPDVVALADEVERTGLMPPLEAGAFNAYCHRPDGLRDEVAAAGLLAEDVLCVEGPAFLLGDLTERLEDPADREMVLSVARAFEAVPELSGIGPHLLATGLRADHAG